MKYFREWSLDCVQNSYSNSHRDDLFLEKGVVSYDGWVKILSARDAYTNGARQIPTNRAINSFDSRSGGSSVMYPTGFLRDYWMGRYYGLIKAPETKDPNLLSVPKRPGEKFGAEPYNGPDRPKIY
jgi:hypothetical protein